MSNYICLVDADNFFVSCERLFQPHLKNKPVAVLSNNDGCVIARSNEVKCLGVAMGAPLFKVKQLVKQHKIHILSSNFSLYSAVSQRVFFELHKHSLRLEKYSIDEYFFQPPFSNDLSNWLRDIKFEIERNIGIPLTFGLSLNKTLAKVAAYHAKEYNNGLGYKALITQDDIAKALAITNIKNVWGIGRSLNRYYKGLGIHTCDSLVELSPYQVRKKTGVTGLKTYYELKGRVCHEISDINVISKQDFSKSYPKSSMVSRTLGQAIYEKQQLHEAIVEFSEIASCELRKNNVLALKVGVFITTDRFKSDYSTASHEQSILPSADNQTIVRAAISMFEKCFKPGLAYRRAGVFLSHLIPANRINLDLFRDYEKEKKAIKLSQALDTINARYGKNTIHHSTRTYSHLWGSRQNHKTEDYFSTKTDFAKVF